MASIHRTTAALLLGFLISPIWAGDCATTPAGNSSDLYITSPDDLKNRTQNCDLDTTGIYIEPEFVGAFSLNGASNVSAVEVNRYNYRISTVDFPVTSVDLNDTKYMRILGLTRMKDLQYVSAPKLESVHKFAIAGGATDLLDFPLLRNVSSMYLYSNFSRTNFPSLQNVSWILSYGPFDPSIEPMSEFQADFPSLETAAVMSIYGNITSWKTPNLKSIKPSNPHNYVTNEAKLSINHNGVPLALDFPVLSEVMTIELSGNLSSVSFPALQNVGKIRISPNGYTNSNTKSTPMTVNLSALRTVEDLSISGNVTSISLDSLTNFTSIYISSLSPTNCTPIIAAYERIRNTKYDPDAYVRGFYCLDSVEKARQAAKYAPKKRHLAKGAIAGIIVGVLAFVCIIAAMWYANIRSKKKKAAIGRRTSGFAENHELRQTDSMSIKDPAPPYHEATRT